MKLAKEWGAKWLIVERNKIGDTGVALLMHAMKALNVELELKEAYSFKDKWTRALPVAALYDRGHVHHVGRYPDLETQVTQWDSRGGGPSPNNLDAFVHVATELMGLARVQEQGEDVAKAFRGFKEANRAFRQPGLNPLSLRRRGGGGLGSGRTL